MANIIPQGGFTPPDPFLRCIRCFEFCEGSGKIGTIMSEVVIRIVTSKSPEHIDVGTMARCCRCNHRAWVEINQTAKDYGITKDMLIQVLNNNNRMDSGFILEDFEKAKGASTSLNNMSEYKPDKTHSQELPIYLPPAEEKIEEVPF